MQPRASDPHIVRMRNCRRQHFAPPSSVHACARMPPPKKYAPVPEDDEDLIAFAGNVRNVHSINSEPVGYTSELTLAELNEKLDDPTWYFVWYVLLDSRCIRSPARPSALAWALLCLCLASSRLLLRSYPPRQTRGGARPVSLDYARA